MKTRSAGDPRSLTEAFRISSVGEKGNGWAKQRRLKGGGSVSVTSVGRKAISRRNPVKPTCNSGQFRGLSRLDDIRGLRIQPSLWSRRLESTARPKRHRVLFQRLPRHRALQLGASRPVINRRAIGLVWKGILISPESLVLCRRARHEIRNASELRMTAT